MNPETCIGKGCIINTSASVDHDCMLEDYVYISVGAHLAGAVSVGEHTWVGAGAVVKNNIDICSNCMIGAGAVVVKKITEAGTYIGIPAARVNKQTLPGGVNCSGLFRLDLRFRKMTSHIICQGFTVFLTGNACQGGL